MVGAPLLSCGGDNAPPCTSGADVRNLDDSAIPQWLKEEIFYKPEPMIGKYWLPTPGVVKASALYPTGKLVVIRAAATDAPENPDATTNYVRDIFFSDEVGKDSIRKYYRETSYGDLLMTEGGVPGWITINKALSQFPALEGDPAYMKAVLKLANVDWKSLDTNNDKSLSRAEVQVVVLIPNAMPGTGFASVRYPDIGSVATPKGTFDFSARPIVYFSLKALADPDHANTPIRVLSSVAHELGHALFNLPDRYGPQTGTGVYDIMTVDTSWKIFTMHDRIKIGWIQPKIINAHLGKCLQFVSSELQNAALILVPPQLPVVKPLEYWVVENRERKYSDGNLDRDLPEDGLVIWYVSEGTYSSGHDDVRLVDFSKADQNPLQYNNPSPPALFKKNNSNSKRLLMNQKGEWSLLWFQKVSNPDLFVYAEF